MSGFHFVSRVKLRFLGHEEKWKAGSCVGFSVVFAVVFAVETSVKANHRGRGRGSRGMRGSG